MDLGLEICLIIVAIVFFCIFLRFIIIEWKNRLLLGGYFKQNAELLREAARRQRREQARRRHMESINTFVDVPPPAFDEALTMEKVFYIDVEETAAPPPTYDDAIKIETLPSSLSSPTTYVLNETTDQRHINGELILSVHNTIMITSDEDTFGATAEPQHFTTITTSL